MKSESIRDKNKIYEILEGLKRENKERELILFMLGISTGLKMNDILRIKVRNIYKGHIQIKLMNTGRYKKINLHEDLQNIIEKYIEGKRKDKYLFESVINKNKPITLTQVYRLLKDIEYEYEVGVNLGTESLRKTYGYNLYKTYGLNALYKEFGYGNGLNMMRYIGLEEKEINELIDRAVESINYFEN